MPEFFLELFSEEIPARMQKAAAADELHRVCKPLFNNLNLEDSEVYFGPRRIAISATIGKEKPGSVVEARGPRENAPEAAIAGFLGKHGARREDLLIADGHYFLRREQKAVSAYQYLLSELSGALAKFNWPKSMRWGQSGDFTWVRPLRRIICLLDGEVVPFSFGPLTASNRTEGHRFLSAGDFEVTSKDDWCEMLGQHFVIADQDERRRRIVEGLTSKAAALGLCIVEDVGLVDEVCGLVEWPVPLIGKIEETFMELPPEVRELSMKVNQRYFATRDSDGKPAPYFAFVSNIQAEDSGAAIIAGNERVLRARLSDARYFWDVDQQTSLDKLFPKLGSVTFHAKIGTQLDRSKRLAELARKIAIMLHADGKTAAQAVTAGMLCKVDLVTGMVGEFPELQGIIGGYYAERNPCGWDGAAVGSAIKTHYQPRGPSDAVPTETLAVSVALADKLDTLLEFFRINEKPTGSGDPYALRRAALGVIRIILENEIRLPLKSIVGDDPSLFDFIIERLRVKLRGEGKRFDVLDAVLASGTDDDLVHIMRRVEAVTEFLQSRDGENLLIGYRRAANILRVESAKDGPFEASIISDRMILIEEKNLALALGGIRTSAFQNTGAVIIPDDLYFRYLSGFASMRYMVDAFFEKVTVNADDPQLRRVRLQLLAVLRDTMNQIADFSKIEG